MYDIPNSSNLSKISYEKEILSQSGVRLNPSNPLSIRSWVWWKKKKKKKKKKRKKKSPYTNFSYVVRIVFGVGREIETSDFEYE